MVLDDWIDGTGYTPDQVLASLRPGMGGMGMAASPSPVMSGMSMPAASPSPSMTGMDGMSSGPSPVPASSTGGPSGPSPVLSGARSRLLGGDAGDVRYPYNLINGRIRQRRGPLPPAPGSGHGSGSSTPPPTLLSASPWAGIR